jgi:N4-gp56 family major capsid protein
MAIQTYALTPGRIEKFKGEIIKATLVKEILSKCGRQIQMPKNNSKTYVARTWVPYAATASKTGADNRNTRFTSTGNAGVDRAAQVINAHLSTDGVSSSSDTLTPLDYTATMKAYECSYSFTRETQDFYEDDIPATMKELIADRVSFVNETINYNALRSCSNVFYGDTTSASGVAATSIATVGNSITLKMLRRIARSLLANSAKPVSKLLKSGPAMQSVPVAPSFFVYIHTDLVSDLRALGGSSTSTSGFFPVENYANPGDAVPGEVGKLENFRFIASPFWPALLSAGATTASAAGMVSVLGTNNDVYPMFVMGEDAYAQIALRGQDALQPSFIPANTPSKSDIHGKRGYAGAYWYKATLIENDYWMALGYVCNATI